MQPKKQVHETIGVAKRRHSVSYFVLTISIVSSILVGFVIGTRVDDALISDDSLASIKKTYRELQTHYDGKLDDKKLIEGANRGLVEAVGDPYTAFFTAKEAAEFENDIEGTFSGIGAELGKKDDKLVVISALDSSPAQKAGLKAGDIIARVDDVDSVDWTIDKAVTKIRGKAGTSVKLTIIRGEEAQNITIVRDLITDPSVKTEEKGDIGIIRISRFSHDTAGLTKEAAEKFANKKGIVIDLRGNGGGYLESAQEVASLWLDEGQIVVTERRGDTVRQTHQALGEPVLKNMPTVVLIDQGSASASEIVAGALQDHGKATLVGEKSFGKGSVQEMVDLPNGAKLKVTIAKWYTPKGKNIGKSGITPDEKVAQPKDLQSTSDPQLEKALDIIK